MKNEKGLEPLNCWNCGLYVRDALLASSRIRRLCGVAKKDTVKVFPMVANEGTTFPFITYQKSGGYYEYDKDVLEGGKCRVDIIVFTTGYMEMIELADAVDDAIYEFFNKARSVAQLTESYENTDGDVFYEVMSFSFDI